MDRADEASKKESHFEEIATKGERRILCCGWLTNVSQERRRRVIMFKRLTGLYFTLLHCPLAPTI